jgi:hypothetical protein
MKKRNLSVFTILMAGLLLAGVALAANVSNDQPDSFAYVGYRLNCILPAFKDDDGVSIPFKPTSILPPIGYQGDFYVDEFSNVKIERTWQELKTNNPDVAQKILAGLSANTDETASGRYRVTGALDPKGAVNGNDALKLAEIRRPKFFGQSPYFEEIAKVERDTYTVEFTVPREPYEQLQLKLTESVKLRGWFIKGEGVPAAKGKKIHALYIFIEGNGGQLFTTQHPAAPCYGYNFQAKQYKDLPYPNKNLKSEQWGRQSRQYIYEFNRAGFDVLLVDKRGHGYSGGVNATNTAEMAEDLFRMLDQLESGEGLTILAPTGQMLQGKQATGLCLRGMPARKVPVILGGFSQGTQAICHAMQKNFVGWTAFNEPDQKFSPAKKYNIKAALLFGDFAGGLGYVCDPDLMAVYQEAARRVELNTIARPTSEILANIDKWPAVFFGKGLWDDYQSAEGTYEAYNRAKGLKELVFYRGPHSPYVGGQEHISYLTKKMTEFATRALVSPGKKYPELKSFKEAVLSSAPYWEPSSRP